MALNSGNVNVAVSGALKYATTDTAAPTDAVTALAAPWRDVGYISDDGVKEARERKTDNIIAWQNADVVRTVTTESSITLNFTMIETNPDSLELFYGRPFDTADGSIEIVPSESGGRRSVVLDYVDGDKQVRHYLPQAEVTEVGELTNASGDPVGYEVTVTGYPSTLGYSSKKWFSELVGVAAA